MGVVGVEELGFGDAAEAGAGGEAVVVWGFGGGATEGDEALGAVVAGEDPVADGGDILRADSPDALALVDGAEGCNLCADVAGRVRAGGADEVEGCQGVEGLASGLEVVLASSQGVVNVGGEGVGVAQGDDDGFGARVGVGDGAERALAEEPPDGGQPHPRPLSF